jgi:N6-adenosine-specific RNA methylase IME4
MWITLGRYITNLSTLLQAGSFSIIYADPPWKYSDPTCNGAANNHYDTMHLEDIKNMPIQHISAPNCVLFMWATYPKLPEALAVIKAWGFTYKSVAFTWVKLNKRGYGHFLGLGRWTRGNPEICLLATKGKPQRISANVANLTLAPVGRHSAKPAIIREKIVQLMGDLPRIELFAREQVPGWGIWGNDQALSKPHKVKATQDALL